MICYRPYEQKPEHISQKIEQKALPEGQQDVQKRDTLKKKWDNQCEEYRHLDSTLAYLACLEQRGVFIANDEMKNKLHEHELQIVILRWKFACSWKEGKLEIADGYAESFEKEKKELKSCLGKLPYEHERLKGYINNFERIKDTEEKLMNFKKELQNINEKNISHKRSIWSFVVNRYSKSSRERRLIYVEKEVKEFEMTLKNMNKKYYIGYVPERLVNKFVNTTSGFLPDLQEHANQAISSDGNRASRDKGEVRLKDLNCKMKEMDKAIDKLHLFQEAQRKLTAAKDYIPEKCWDRIDKLADEEFTLAMKNCERSLCIRPATK